MKKPQLDLAAVEELAKAAEWYADRRQGLDQQFLDEVEHLLEKIRSAPKMYERLQDVAQELDIHRAFLRKFPYALIFVELTDEIRVIAVAHTSRRPGYWLYRLDQQT